MPSLLLALALAAAPASSDPLAEAHGAADPAHVLAATRVESAIESLNTGIVQVFGTRRELRCPGGGTVSESSCNPCSYAAQDWPDRPTEQWIVDVSWAVGDEAAHARAVAELEHWRRHFELQPRGGSEKGGRRWTFFEVLGPRLAPAPGAEITGLRLLVGGRESALARVPAGAKDVEIEARASRRSAAGLPVEAPEAEVRFESACAAVTPTGPRSARVAPHPGVERCEVKAAAGKASAAIAVGRELQLFVTYEGARVDDLVLEGVSFVDLGFEAAPAGKGTVAPEWKAEGGALEPLEGGAVRLRIEARGGQARVSLLDKESGASATATVRRKAPPAK